MFSWEKLYDYGWPFFIFVHLSSFCWLHGITPVLRLRQTINFILNIKLRTWSISLSPTYTWTVFYADTAALAPQDLAVMAGWRWSLSKCIKNLHIFGCDKFWLMMEVNKVNTLFVKDNHPHSHPSQFSNTGQPPNQLINVPGGYFYISIFVVTSVRKRNRNIRLVIG